MTLSELLFQCSLKFKYFLAYKLYKNKKDLID